MFDILYVITSFGFFVWAVRSIFFWGALLEAHDYSLRSIVHFLTATANGRSLLLSPLSLVKWGIILFYPIIIFSELWETYYHLFITAVYLTEAIFVFETIRKHRMRRPRRLAPKTALIVGITLLLVILLFLFAPIDIYLWLVFIDRSIVFLMFLLLLIIGLPEEFYWEYRLLKTSERQQSGDHPTTVLVLGSRDATVVKHLLYQVLCERFPVLTTADTPNLRKIIRTIEQNLDTSPQFFVAEVQSTTLQEFRQAASLLSPRFVIIESLPFQKPVSFREILDAAIFLKQGKRLRPTVFLAPEAEQMVRSSRSGAVRSERSSVSRNVALMPRIELLSLKPSRTTLRVRQNGNTFSIETSLVTAHSAHVLLPVIAVLSALDYAPADITRVLRSVVLPADFLHFSQENGIVILNNSSETDPRYLAAFADYLANFRKKKILILDADIFAGKTTREEVMKIGNTLAKQFQYIFLISSPAERVLRSGIRAGKKYCIVTATDPVRIASYLPDLAAKGDLLLFYGPRTGAVLQEVTRSLRRAQ